MATILATNMVQGGKRTVTETTLAGSDTFTHSQSKDPILILRNPTVGALSPTIDGDGGTTVSIYGLGIVDVSGGFSVGSIAAGAAVAIQLNTIKEYLQGNITINSGAGLVASLLEF